MLPSNTSSAVIVMDKEDYDMSTRGTSWYVSTLGYAVGRPFEDKSQPSTHHSLIQPVRPGYSVDHVNRIKTDNRRANLRESTQSQQNANRDDRVDKQPLPRELVDKYGTLIRRLPRYISMNTVEMKFFFKDHPFIDEVRDKTGAILNTTGTKAAGCCVGARLRDCLEKYVAMCEAHRAAFGVDDRRPSATLRAALEREYVAIAEAAHAAHAHVFPSAAHLRREQDGAPMDTLDDEELARHLISILPAPVEAGPRHLSATDVLYEADAAVVRTKGESRTLYDAKHARALASVNWEEIDTRVHISPAVERAFPTLRRHFPAPAKKLLLSELIYHVLEGNPVVADHCLVPRNRVKHDVRMRNIELLPGIGKNYKPAATRVAPDGVDIGYKYLPPNVGLSRIDAIRVNATISQLGPIKRATLNVSGSNADGTPRTYMSEFRTKVVPLLRPDFEATHAVYTQLVDDYMYMGTDT